MLKKRNIAMVMAATTVATSVMPAFASTIETVKVDEAKMIADVQEMLDTKYTNSTVSNEGVEIQAGEEFKNSVYKIELEDSVAKRSIRIENISQLKAEIEKAKVAGNDVTLRVTDKGHRIDENGNIVNTELTKNRYYDGTFVDSAVGTNTVSNTNLAHITDGTTTATATVVNRAAEVTGSSLEVDAKADILLPSGVKIELVQGDYVLDLSKPIDANGNLVTLNGTDEDAAAVKKIVGFKLAEDAEASIKPIAAKRVSNIKITGNIEIEENVSDLLTEQGYTKKGAEIVNFLIKARTADTTSKVGNNGAVDYTTVVNNGTKYYVRDLDESQVSQLSLVTTEKEGYSLTIKLQVKKDAADLTAANSNVEIVIKSDSQADLVKLRSDITTKSKVEAGNVTVLAGDDRFETAIAVSGSRYRTKNADATIDTRVPAGGIVLVGENAIVDGLAAGPLAAQQDAPILLTKKDEVPEKTMAEIKRVVNKGSKVYIIGGENTISKEVEAQLIKEMNADIVRLEGEDRYETSIAIAEKLGTDIGTTAYVVGGTGLVDAMSIAALASKEQNAGGNYDVAPIIVTPKEGLSKDAIGYLRTSTITNVEAIGGASHISTDVLTEVNGLKNSAGTKLSAVRLAGDNRNDTNAKVINKYASATKVYIAKDGDSQLVDALAAAPIVGRTNGIMVLATNDITTEQKNAINGVITSGAAGNEVTQVGNGIADTLVQKIAKFLGL